MRITPVLPFLLAGCLSLGHCGPTPTEVSWVEPDFAADLAAADPEGWNVNAEPRPHGFPIEHPLLERWNASIRSVSLREPQPMTPGNHSHEPQVAVHLATPARLSVHVADGGSELVRPTVLRFLEALTDGNETEREAWADGLLAEHDEEADPPTPEQRHLRPVPHYMDLPPERLRVQAFVDEHLEPGDPLPVLRSGDWSFSVDYAETVAWREGQDFRASPDRNWFNDDAWREEYSQERALEDFRAAYASLGLGPAPKDAEVQSVVC